MVVLRRGFGVESEVEDGLLETSRGLDFAQDTLSNKLPDSRDTDHDTGTELGDISFALSDRGVGKSFDPTVTNRHTSERQTHFDDEFENVGEGKEGKVGVLRSEQFVQKRPNGSD